MSSLAESIDLEWLAPIIATAIAVTLVISFFLLPITSVVVASFSRNLVVLFGTILLSLGGLLISFHTSSMAIPVGVGMELGGLLLAIAGTRYRKETVHLWNEIERLHHSEYDHGAGHRTTTN